MFDMYKDLFKSEVCGQKYSPEALLSANPDTVELVKFPTMGNRATYTPFQTARAALQWFEDALPGVGGQEFIPHEYLCGPFVSYVDLAMWITLDELDSKMPQWAETLKLPKLKAMKLRIDALPAMQAYLASCRIMPPINSEYAYVEDKYCRRP